MNRTLVLSDEAARHPFRRSLPAHVRAGAALLRMTRGRVSLDDVREFLLAYCACFIAISLFVW